MKRQWVIASAAVLIIAGLVLPWGSGYMAEKLWRQAAQEANASQTWLAMQVERYNRGFFNSEFEGTFLLHDPVSGEELNVPYLATVSHGVTASLTDFKPLNGWTPEGEDWFGDEVPRLTAEARLWGTVVAELTVPRFSMSSDNNAETLFGSGGTVRLKSRVGAETADINADWSSLVVASEELDLRMSNLTVEQEMRQVIGDIWTGDGILTLGSLELMPANADAVIMRGLSLESANSLSDNDTALDASVSIRLEELEIAADTLGPHRIQFELTSLDIDAWGAFSRSMADMQMASFAADKGDPTALQQQMQAMSGVGESMQALAAAGFSVGFPDIHLASPEGPVKGKILVTHPGSAGDSTSLLIMPVLEGDMELSMPLALAENYEAIRMQTAPLIKDGLLITEGDRLVLKATLKDLVLNINGRPLSLPPLI